MRLTVWTPSARSWLGEIAGLLADTGSDAVTLQTAEPSAGRGLDEPVGREPAEPPSLDVYHVADRGDHGFVYRALQRLPGLVVLEDWGLERLVYDETVGRGDPDVFRREARRAHGPRGAFIAEQVLRGLGGGLVPLLPLNERVLEASLGLVVTSDAAFARAGPRFAGRPLVRVSPAAPEAAAAALLALARRLWAELPLAHKRFREERALEATALGRALGELRPFARELGLDGLPSSLTRRLASLFQRSGPAGVPPT